MTGHKKKGPKPRAVLERFLSKVELIPWSGCWLWMGHVCKTTGYGRIRISEPREMMRAQIDDWSE